jgi:hypothetical protein
VRWGESADWGVVTADLMPKPFFWGMRVVFSPVCFRQSRVVWKPGMKHIQVDVTNGYNSIDLSECTLRVMMAGGGRWMSLMSGYQDVPMRAKPGQTKRIRIPIWNAGSLSSLQGGSPICCRCIVLDPKGFRPIMHDILVMPESLGEDRAAMPMGPDAVEET